MNDNYKLVLELHFLADWVEHCNNVQCHSVPRKAAYLIEKLEEENNQMRLQLNKRDLTLMDYVNRVIGFVRLQWYLWRKKK